MAGYVLRYRLNRFRRNRPARLTREKPKCMKVVIFYMNELLEAQPEEQLQKARGRGRKFVSKILLRVTAAEHQALKKRAAKHEISLSRYAVTSALERPIPARKQEREQITQTLFELRKIGSNINQIAHALNSARLKNAEAPPSAEIQAALLSVNSFITSLKKRL